MQSRLSPIDIGRHIAVKYVNKISEYPISVRNEHTKKIAINPKYARGEEITKKIIESFTFNKFVKIEEGSDPDKFSHFERVYSGHIHYAQKYKNVRMLGCPYELTRSDSGNKKSVWLLDLETNEERSFENTRSPRFVKYRLEWILEQPIG
jgi:hypothetical protein